MTGYLDAGKLTAAQRKRFIIIDNSPPGISGDWDHELLKDWDSDDLDNWGLINETEGHEIEETETKPYKKSHVLISFELDKSEYVFSKIQSLIGLEGIQIEQTSN